MKFKEEDFMLDEKLWRIAQEQAKNKYESEYGDWEEADKYERQDIVFSEYMKLKETTK